MNIGDYVRTKSYGIKKINGFSSTLEEDFIDCDYDKTTRILINKKDIVKSSPNIIDLIEIGDYVNGYEVTSKDQFLGFGNHDWYMTNDEIKSIVTKEQFESIKYEVN